MSVYPMQALGIESIAENPGPGPSTRRPALPRENRPLMVLFQRLIRGNSRQSKLLTDAQILRILQKEFQIETATLHELEVDIYVNIIKRFMKDWRKWDEFEKKIRCLRQKEASQTITNIIEAKYIELKTYLQEQLDMAKPLAQEAVREVIKEHGDSNETSDSDNIVMQIECTRKQLNELVITQPIPGVEVDKVFKVAELVPSSVSYPKCLPIESILNWYNVRITIDTKTLSYQRMTNHQMKHVLVNMKLGPRVHTRVLKRHMQVKEADELTTEVMNKERIYKFFNKLLLNETVQSSDQKTILLALTEVMKKDLNGMETVKAPATYRQYSARYPYYRIFKREVDRALSTDGDQLYMEETIAPVHVFLIGKATLNIKSKRKMNFTLECMECKVKFSGNEMCARVTEHFETMHLSEPNWNCTNCEDTFPMFELARNKWQHECSQM